MLSAFKKIHTIKNWHLRDPWDDYGAFEPFGTGEKWLKSRETVLRIAQDELFIVQRRWSLEGHVYT